MNNTYLNLIQQSYRFPQDGFDLNEGYLTFNGISLQYLIKKYGTPFKLLYLPKIGQKIEKARNYFQRAIKSNNYSGSYNYCYCTKCCHFSHVVKTALKHGVHLETSSSFDIDLILELVKEGVVDENLTVIHNGYKTDDYLIKILQLSRLGFLNSILVLDSKIEIERVRRFVRDTNKVLKIGIRMAIDEEPQSAYSTSRLGIRASEIIDFYVEQIKDDPKFSLEMLHFFVDTGIKDSIYYWGEFQKAINLFAKLNQMCPSLRSLNLGGGFPIRNNLNFEYDFEHIISALVANLKKVCSEYGIMEPNIYTEFGKYTVGESGAIIFTVLEQKNQNDTEKWYLVNNSLMNTIPDSWSILEKFILLPINKWDHEYVKVNVGGISCDHSDYYNSEDLNQQLFLPKISKNESEPLFVGFFHTGAYQDSISGYGGIKHCLIPAPKMIIIDQDDKGNYVDYIYRNEQTVDEMLSILGYKNGDDE